MLLKYYILSFRPQALHPIQNVKQQVEFDWLKKNLTLSLEMKRGLVEPSNTLIGAQRQCSLIDLSRSSYYYSPIGVSQEGLEIVA